MQGWNVTEISDRLQIICDRLPKLRMLVLSASHDLGIFPVFRKCPNLTELQLYDMSLSKAPSDMFRLFQKLKKLSFHRCQNLSASVCRALGQSLSSTPIECVEFTSCRFLMFSLIQSMLDFLDLSRLKVLGLTDLQFSEFSECLRPLSNPKSFLLSNKQFVNVDHNIYPLSDDRCDHFFQWDDLTYFYEG